jgi:hypothetical protein
VTGPNIVERTIVRLGRIGYDHEAGEPKEPTAQWFPGAYEVSIVVLPSIMAGVEFRDDSGYGPGMPAVEIRLLWLALVVRRAYCYTRPCYLEPGHYGDHEFPREKTR